MLYHKRWPLSKTRSDQSTSNEPADHLRALRTDRYADHRLFLCAQIVFPGYFPITINFSEEFLRREYEALQNKYHLLWILAKKRSLLILRGIVFFCQDHFIPQAGQNRSNRWFTQFATHRPYPVCSTPHQTSWACAPLPGRTAPRRLSI